MPARESLAAYREKRDPGRTPEPFGDEAEVAVAGAGLFVIQKHAARRTHYDLRLEMDGVLASWAVPKGPSTDPAEKRLAVHVEDHPLEYADFEGIIPEGEYGAGAVIVWDQGRWIPLEDPAEGLASGKLLFELRGHKLRGVWTLVKLRKSESGKDWLLIRERRGGGTLEVDDRIPEASILSGLTVEELGRREEGLDPGAPVRAALEELAERAGGGGGTAGPRRRTLCAKDVKLMLARNREDAFSRPGWLFELKLDGFRMLAEGGAEGALLRTRNGKDATATFPELARALGALPFERVLLDGEVVVLDDRGFPSFQRLQRRAQLRRRPDIRSGSVERPAAFYAFDLLGFEGFDLRPLPLETRKRLLRRVLPPAGPLRYSEHFEETGETLYEQVTGMGLEGIVGKEAASPYRGGRSPKWVKVRADRTADFAVVGFTEPAGSRAGFGALHLAVWERSAPATGAGDAEGGRFVYAGRVGTGFTDVQLEEIRAALEGDRRTAPPCDGPLPAGREHVWVEPRLVSEVRYKEWTEDGLLRQPAFLRLREDKAPRECEATALRERPGAPADLGPATDPLGGGGDRGGGAGAAPDVLLAEPLAPLDAPPAPEEMSLTNLDKVFWPAEGYTKGDLIDYYRKVAGRMLPYLEDRPVVLTRYPDGIEGKHFFQKDAPGFVPEWIRTETIHSESAERDISYFVVQDEASLLYLANLGTIPFHIWASRVGSLDRPDWCVLDLDPKEASFAHVIEIARHLRALCEEIGLPTYVKTTGSTGLHVLIPLGGALAYEESRTLGELLARLVAADLPGIATVVRDPRRRDGKVYVDFLQNRRGQTIAAPYSVRPVPGAKVSAPLRWKEVKSGLDRDRFTIRSVPRRLASMKDDPLRPVLGEPPDLLAALERLQARLGDT